jgi:hypothetical protein
MKLTRDSYINKNLESKIERGNALVLYGTVTGGFVAQGFQGKRAKFDFNYKFKTKEHMDKYIDAYFDNIENRKKAREDRKVRTKDDAVQFLASLKPGVILHDSWGYDQTNVEFFEVISVDGCKVTVREIAHKDLESTSWCSCMTEPQKGVYTGQPKTKIVRGSSIKIDSCVSLTIWNGKPKHKSWGH